MEEILRNIIEDMSNAYGTEFFYNTTLSLHRAINADYTLIANIDKQQHQAHTIAFVIDGQLVENISYSLINTPCDTVVGDGVCIYPKQVCRTFPHDDYLIEKNIEGYLGAPLYNSHGEVVAIIAALFNREISAQEQDLTLTLFQLFSGRIASELERSAHEQALSYVNKNLEKLVEQRALALDQTNVTLALAQSKLIESEKMAALGDLVSGIAHEVNTPLGVAITAQSHLHEVIKQFKNKFQEGKLTRSDMTDLISQNEQAVDIIQRNLERAKVLVDNFKKTASDQHSLDKESINLKSYYQQVLSTLTPLLKQKRVTCQLNCDESLVITTFPGVHAQIITNLVNNSVMHGFSDSESNHIVITITPIADQMIQVEYRDNGCGIKAHVKDQIFEPFYTTARGEGGTGLGMAIIKNRVTKKLGGKVRCVSSNEGACFVYTMQNLTKKTRTI